MTKPTRPKPSVALGAAGKRLWDDVLAIYELRPDVCRECQPGDDACTMARERAGLPPLAS